MSGSSIKFRLLVSVSLICPSLSLAATYVAGQHYFGANRFIEYIAGNLPIIISAPHGGTRDTSAIPVRPYGDSVSDMNTIELALACGDSLRKVTGGYPHIIICHLRRSKLDVNRNIDTGAAGNALALVAWREFHAFIDSAEKQTTSSFGAGCYVDLHGHAHPIQRLELGYLLGASSLSMSDDSLALRKKYSSVKYLASTTDSSFAKLIRGAGSLGGLMQSAGFPSVPSPQYAGPDTNPYFGGGYDVERHGSRDSGTISGIQIECNLTRVRDRPQSWARFAGAFARSMQRYFVAHFKMPLPVKVAYQLRQPSPQLTCRVVPAHQEGAIIRTITASGREIPPGVFSSLSIARGESYPTVILFGSGAQAPRARPRPPR